MEKSVVFQGRIAPGAVYVDTPLETIPMFQRGGTIIPAWERVRRSSALMRQDPITLYIAINFKVSVFECKVSTSYDTEKKILNHSAEALLHHMVCCIYFK